MNYKKINWKLLKSQKATLLKIIHETTDKIQKDNLTGILYLINSIQDYAVDNLDYSENKVFNLKKETKFITKKAFKEKCYFTEYGTGQNKKNAIFYDWKENDKGRGYKYMIKAWVGQVKKKELFDMFYEWIVKDGLKVNYAICREAKTDAQRFKIPITG